MAEAVEVTFAESAYEPLIIAAVDAKFRSERPWSGLVDRGHAAARGRPRCCAWSPGGPAAEAGIAAGDLVLGADGQPVTQTADLLAARRGRRRSDDRLVLQAEGRRPGRSHAASSSRSARAARDPALRPRPRLQQGDDGPARRGRRATRAARAAAYARSTSRSARMHFGDYRRRPRVPRRRRKASSPQRPGSRAARRSTILGLALEQLGYQAAGGGRLPGRRRAQGGDADRQRRPSGLARSPRAEPRRERRSTACVWRSAPTAGKVEFPLDGEEHELGRDEDVDDPRGRAARLARATRAS